VLRGGRAFWVHRAPVPAGGGRFRGGGGGLADRPAPGGGGRAADEVEAACVAEMFRTRYFDLRIKHFLEQILGLPTVSVRPR